METETRFGENEFLEEAKRIHTYCIGIRRHLHEYPELTSKEFRTVEYIRNELDCLDTEYIDIADGGVLAWLDGAEAGQQILLRADCDALPIQESEVNEKQRKVSVSRIPGVSHVCGHDCHVAMLLGAVRLLKKHRRQFKGRIYFLFERGEEGGNCIYYVMKELEERKIRPDACVGLHVDSSLSVGTFGIRKGISNSGNVNFKIRLVGEGGHGSRPDLANNPIDCFITLGCALKDLRMKYIFPDQQLTFTIASVKAGEKRNVIPKDLIFLGTVRFISRESGRIFKERMYRMVEEICEAYGCKAEYLEYTGPSFPIYNDPDVVEIVTSAVYPIAENNNIIEIPVGMGSESFATLAAFYPAAFLRVGVRNEEKGITSGGHRPEFDVDEDGLDYGTAAYVSVALEFLRCRRAYPQGFPAFVGTADDFLEETGRQAPERYDKQVKK
ncbi:MAG: amidohydrolase [Clostridiales bacterium]|nr:amidohydrolase [Clostridiales bacterium]